MQKELENALGPIRQKLADLESENSRLRAEIAQLKDSFS
jgi:regulator of replication initiation timing